ncbi:MAG: hypothetical protein NDJ24_05875 [Alphaproteobacteria bacterium]|nr:hypothetical protein [Alphaproteobacteria bacterium]
MAEYPFENKDFSLNLEAALLRNRRGEVCIAFDDPVYVHADAIFVDPEDHAIHAIIFQTPYLIAHVSDEMLSAFAASPKALLAAVQPDGQIFELMAPIIVGHA